MSHGPKIISNGLVGSGYEIAMPDLNWNVFISRVECHYSTVLFSRGISRRNLEIFVHLVFIMQKIKIKKVFSEGSLVDFFVRMSGTS